MRHLIALGLIMVACGGEGQPPSATTEPEPDWPAVHSGAGRAELVTFPDGTRCVIFQRYEMGGIDCDFGDR